MKVGVVSLLFCVLSCNTTEPPPPPPAQPLPTITLGIEDAGVTEVWLRVSMPETVTQRMFTLFRDGNPIDTVVLTAADSVLVNEGLFPNQQYTYQAFRTADSLTLDSTGAVPVTTMDTTSHDFIWEMFEFGDHSSSVLLDVAIINENDIWAVGEIFLNDSTGQADIDSYNAAHWDGQQWQPIRVPVQICGTPAIGSPILRSVFSFSSAEVLFTEGGNLVTWDGVEYSQICLPSGLILGTLRKIWGRSTTDLYMVGDRGTIVHWDGSTWRRIESGTELDVNDLFGVVDSEGLEVYAVAARQFVTLERQILQVKNTIVTALSDSGIPGSLQSLWFEPGRKYYVAGNGMYWKRLIADPDQWLDTGATPYYLYSIHGGELNDIVACGTFGELVHFNGVSWRSYRTATALSQGLLYKVRISDNYVVAVGFDGSRAVVARGVR